MVEGYRYWKWTKDTHILKTPRPFLAEKKADPPHKKAPCPTVVRDPPNDKRALCNERISNRYMIIQKSINPYVPVRGYINDLQVQDKFLRPKDSNIKDKE